MWKRLLLQAITSLPKLERRHCQHYLWSLIFCLHHPLTPTNPEHASSIILSYLFAQPNTSKMQSARTCAMSATIHARRAIRWASTSSRTMLVNRAVNEFQSATRTTPAARFVDRICIMLANDRATTRTEQLVWLAEYSLGVSRASKDPATHCNGKGPDKSVAPEMDGRQASERVDVWPHLW